MTEAERDQRHKDHIAMMMDMIKKSSELCASLRDSRETVARPVGWPVGCTPFVGVTDDCDLVRHNED